MAGIVQKNMICNFRLSLYYPLIILAMITSTAFGQSNCWPFELALPDTGISDSSRISPIKVTSELTINDIIKSKNSITFYNKNRTHLIQQNLQYLITNYNNGIQNHYIDLSGKFVKRNIFRGNGDLGLDWTPGLYYYRSKDSGAVQVPVDLGPVIDLSIFSIPVEIRSGLSAYGWNNEFNRTTGLSFSSYQAEPGYYGGCNIGDTLLRWLGLPVVANVSILGKSIGSTALGVVKSSLKTVWGTRSSDSIYFSIGDSLSNGKELYGVGTNSTLYSTTPWKVEHNFLLTGALRGKERFLLRPAVLYSYSLKTIKYPVQPDLLDNVRTRKNSLDFQAQSGEDARIDYKGGISFTWDNVDWIYDEDIIKINSDKNYKKQSTNLGDCQEYTVLTDHDVYLRLPNRVAFNYQLHASKSSRMYPYSYIDSTGLMITNENENDLVRILNHGGLLFEITDTTAIELYGEYAQNFHYYYKKARSGESETTDEYKVGLNANLTLGPLQIGENVLAEVDRSDYKFKNVHKGANFDPPVYSRKISSLMIVCWPVNEQWTVTGKWNETYYDKGRWYKKAYSDSSHLIENDCYAIESKSTDYSIQLLTGYLIGNSQFEGGVLLRDNYLRYFNDSTNNFEPGILEKGYFIEPSLEYVYMLNNLLISTKIRRKINTEVEDRWKMDKYWDISLILKVGF